MLARCPRRHAAYHTQSLLSQGLLSLSNLLLIFSNINGSLFLLARSGILLYGHTLGAIVDNLRISNGAVGLDNKADDDTPLHMTFLRHKG